MSPTLPSWLASRCPVPFVLGPLNGGLPWLQSYDAERGQEKEWLVQLRDLHRRLPYHSATYDHAAVILAAFTHTILDLPEDCRTRVINFPEVGIDPAVFHPPTRPRSSTRLRFLFAGRLVPYKLPELVVECFERSPILRQHELVIAGDGPEEPRLRDRILAAGLSSCVKLVGRKSQREVGELMRSSDVFVFPSIRELGAGVVAEAMASGLCCVAVDYGGPAELLAGGRGVKLGPVPRDPLTQRFTLQLEQLAQDPAEARRRGRLAHDYAVSQLSWDVKAQRVVEAYRWALGQRRERPDFYGPGPTDLAAAA
jgi:glycosyltransferase involved in cell wall biosynthesis